MSTWIAWHLTHEMNLGDIVASGSLLPDSKAKPKLDIGEAGIKARRRLIATGFHDGSVVADYVPLYWTAKSPMMFREVRHGAGGHPGGAEPLVLLGVAFADIFESDLEWCVSDGNASQDVTSFVQTLAEAQEIVAMDPLLEANWKDTITFADKQRRRQAEVLVRPELPLDFVIAVVTCYATTRDRIRTTLQPVMPKTWFGVEPNLFFR